MKAKGICKVHGCQNHAEEGRTLCSKHKARRMKEINPLSYTFNVIRQNAKRRGIEFMLTLEDFRDFCERTNYLRKK